MSRAGELRKTEIARRTAFLAEARAFTRHVSVVVDDAVFLVPTSDCGVGARLFANSKSTDTAVLARALDVIAGLGGLVPDEPVFVDVGANLGTTTVAALRRHGFSAGIALEPSPATFRTLRANLIVNGLDGRVQALQVAVSDEEGTANFDMSNSNSGDHRIQRTARAASPLAVTVQMVTLDGLVERGTIDLDRVGMLWVDAAGHESYVLAGASRFLEAGVPIVTALKQRWPEPTRAVVDLLMSHYTDVLNLRGDRRRGPATELRELVASVGHSTDVLLVRR